MTTTSKRRGRLASRPYKTLHPPPPINPSPLKFMKATPAPEAGEEAIPRGSEVDKRRLTLDYRCMKKKPTTPMKNPPHPGKVVRVSCLEPLGLYA